ncbi:hypothetical protein BAUCODRAFT_150013 [Baudoinia panamericana UAMH 10762]|uniref:Uncharacterized protein n=1 Tax=Baudoinia panamericana (strain UAMH 10762) TaxID=717646 RepID=M2N413_BAUPA|nr:uncharacterized protein BAUCODRAFT_150013 [Baudoinia panamericana UAMH 10762]EMC93759.1 hypothetical protein BAUCODRAFT_150013 [Baudoinia panamericana UAMH 10762]
MSNSQLSSTSTMTTSRSRSPLLELQAEFRNEIFKQVLHGDDGTFSPLAFGYMNRTALMRICKQISQETTSIFYSSLTFVLANKFWRREEFKLWLRSLVNLHASLIQRPIRAEGSRGACPYTASPDGRKEPVILEVNPTASATHHRMSPLSGRLV